MIPSPYEFVLLALAAASLWKLIGDDRIGDRPRDWLLERVDRLRDGTYWGDFLVCPWCAGFWVTVLVYTAWIALGPGTWHSAQLLMAGVVVMALRACVGVFGVVLEALGSD